MKQCLLILLILCFYKSPAQLQGQPLADSLEAAVLRMPDDSNKVKAYIRITQIYYSLNPLKTFAPAEKGLELAEKIKWKSGIARLHNNIGLFVSDTGNYALGNEHYKKALVLNEALDAKTHQINNLNNIGRNLQFESDFTQAATYFFKALKIAQDIKSDEHIALVGTNLTSCFYRQKNFSKSIEYAEMTITHAKLSKNTRHEISALSLLGTIHLEQKDTAGSKTFFQQALQICEATNNQSDMVKVLLNMSVISSPDYRKGIALMLRVDSIITIINPGSETDLVNNYNLAEAYHALAKQVNGSEKTLFQNKSLERLKRAKQIAGDRPEIYSNILLLESDMQEEAGNYKDALSSFRRSTFLSDSLFSQDKKNEIAGLEGKHKLAIKDNELAINQLKLASQQRTQWGLLAGLALVMIIGILIYRQSQARKKTNQVLQTLNTQLEDANKTKARFFGILSHDLRSPIVKLVHFLHLQKDDPDLLDKEQSEQYRENISDSAENLLNTMEAMLLWSKEQMDNFKPNIKTVPVERLYDQVRDFFGPQEKVNLRFVNEERLEINTDENYLRTIMQNLTSNALRILKDTPDASILWEAKKMSGAIELSITDNGPGINSEQKSRLFQDTVIYNDKSGFGLQLIRDLAKAVNHKISVESEPGKGTRFVLQIDASS